MRSWMLFNISSQQSRKPVADITLHLPVQVLVYPGWYGDSGCHLRRVCLWSPAYSLLVLHVCPGKGPAMPLKCTNTWFKNWLACRLQYIGPENLRYPQLFIGHVLRWHHILWTLLNIQWSKLRTPWLRPFSSFLNRPKILNYCRWPPILRSMISKWLSCFFHVLFHIQPL